MKLRVVGGSWLFSVIVLSSLRWSPAIAAEPTLPQPVDPGVKVNLFASEPQIVTPIGASVDAKGRLFVVESNTHFRPKDYKGPATDRILILEDSLGSGKADRVTVFYEAGQYLMNVVAEREGSVLVSQRNEIFRLLPDDQGKAGKKVLLAHLETKADYPHNGLHGLAQAADGSIYFGIGENFGGAYVLVGADGQKLADDTGTGAIFKMDRDGKGLSRVAGGFWNPFGLGLDPNGQLWAVDNDPDGRPPCRLIDVAPGGHYGFEFRYGRTGMHPLQAWDGELPGTLGMTAGVGEAPSAVTWSRGRIFVSSWRDHQVESYVLTPKGATYTGAIRPILKGGENFRPVGLAFGPDGSLFVTDWASKSYPVHGSGRIWKVTFANPVDGPAAPIVNDARKRATQLRESSNLAELLAALDDVDPATAQAAAYGLSKSPDVENVAWSSLKSPRQKVGLLMAMLIRNRDATQWVSEALKDSDEQVLQMAVRCVTEQGLKGTRADLETLLHSPTLSSRLLGMTVAAMNQLDGDKSAKIDSKKLNAVLLARLDAADATDSSKAVALRAMQASHPALKFDQLKAMTSASSPALQIEAVRYLNADTDPVRFDLLSNLATDAKLDPAIRAEAVLGLAADAAGRVDLLLKLATDDAGSVRAEALRALRPIGATLTTAQRSLIQTSTAKHSEDAELAGRILNPVPATRPAETDELAWKKILAAAPGDPDAGRRIFFHPGGPTCYRCHMVEGRGRAIGPDLTKIGHSRTREHVLESILDPSREIAPLYTLWAIKTKQGELVEGMLLRRDGQANEVYVDSTGMEIKVKEPDVVDRKMRNESLMPTGLVQTLTDQELRDLIAFLAQKR